MDKKHLFYQRINGITSFREMVDIATPFVPVAAIDENADCFTNADEKVLFRGYSPIRRNLKGKLFCDGKNNILTEQEKEFIEEHRIKILCNHLMRGFYADIYCNGQAKPNGKYVGIVIDSYTKVLEKCDEADAFAIIYSLAYNSYNYCKKQEEKREAVNNAILLYLASREDNADKFDVLINCYNWKFFSAEDIWVISERNQLLQNLTENYNTNLQFLQVLLNCVDKSDKESLRCLYHKLAENEELVIRLNLRHKFTIDFLQRKYQYLRKGEYYQESEECYAYIMELKANGEGMNKKSIKKRESSEHIMAMVNRICNSTSPIHTIATDDSLLPLESDDGKTMMEELNRLGMKVIAFDINGNSISSDDKNIYNKLNFLFRQSYSSNFIVPMYESIKILNNKGVFTENTITDYLASSWIGESRFPVNEYLKESQESWITTIKPGLRILVNEITKEINSDCRDKGDYVCAIDSLTLKIEGCIRDACRRLNIPTVKDNGEEVSLEHLLKSLNDRHVITKPTYNMLAGILTKQHLNLRNNIAHAFTSSANYSIETALTILHCLLRLTTFKVT